MPQFLAKYREMLSPTMLFRKFKLLFSVSNDRSLARNSSWSGIQPRRPDHLGRLAHYEISEVIGCGGMGIVMKAYDEKLQRLVAIKALDPTWAASDAARKRFVREAQSAAAVCHDHLVPIYAVEDGGAAVFYLRRDDGGFEAVAEGDVLGGQPFDAAQGGEEGQEERAHLPNYTRMEAGIQKRESEALDVARGTGHNLAHAT